MEEQGLSRRNFLWAATSAAVLAGCSDSGSDDPSGDNTRHSTPGPGKYRESPMMAERVEAGDLPPLTERLPKQPYVVRSGTLISDEFVNFQSGRFGGTLQLPQDSPEFDSRTIHAGLEPLLWAPGGFSFSEGVEIEGNVVAGFEVNADATMFTFHMREGLRWSDGEPVTIEDVQFVFEDVFYNELLTPTVPIWLRAAQRPDGAPPRLEVVDDLTFSLVFDAPYGAFPAQLAFRRTPGYTPIIGPRHYLEQFHIKYANKSSLQELLEEEDLDEDQWPALFASKHLGGIENISIRKSLGHPVLTPWMMSERSDGVLQYERNPYYFKVDTDGNQLPYIDRLQTNVVQDQETLATQALFGEFDYVGDALSRRHLPLIGERVDTGELNAPIVRSHWVPIDFELNLTYPDDAWKSVVRDVRFRRALSLAIDRDEIVETFFLGEFGSPSTQTNTAEFDPDEAERLLDEMGLNERDSEGWRIGPDGNVVTVPIETRDYTEDHIPICELVVDYWRSVGVWTTLRQVDQVHNRGNDDIVATAFRFTDPDLWPKGYAYLNGYFPNHEQRWGLAWDEWIMSDGQDGEEPPQELKDLYDLHGQLMSAPIGSPESMSAAEAIIENYRTNVWTIVPVEGAYGPVVFNSRVKNVPESGNHDIYGLVITMSMEQWYLEE